MDEIMELGRRLRGLKDEPGINTPALTKEQFNKYNRMMDRAPQMHSLLRAFQYEFKAHGKSSRVLDNILREIQGGK